MSIYSIGVTALNTAQLGLSTTSHNISNVSTDGYHRQQIVQSTNFAVGGGAGYIGQGVHVDTIKRLYSQYLDMQVQQAQTQSSHLDSYLSEISQIDNMLADPGAGLSPALQDFFQAMEDVATNPQTVPSRQALLSTTNSLLTRFQTLSQRFTEIRDGLNTQISESVSLISSYAKRIAEANQQIAQMAGATGQPPNDLLDQRDQLITELNKEVRATVVRQDDGSYNIFIGNGQPLVVGQQAFKLSAVPSPDDQQRYEVAYNYGASSVLLPQGSLDGGRLGGLLDFRTTALDLAENALGRTALGLAQSINSQHRLGQDLNSNLGGDFFAIPSMNVLANVNNTGSAAVTATLSNAQYLTTSDYRLVYDGANYALTRLSDNTQTTIAPAQLAAGYTIDGMTLQLAGGTPNANDKFLIQPTRFAARDLGLSATINTTTVAAAAPIRTAAALSNLGTGKISDGVVNSPFDKVTLTFTSATTFDVLDSTSGATLATGVSYTSGANISYNGWTTQISGAAASGDVFVVDRGVASKTLGSSAATISEATLAVTPDPNLQQSVTITFTSPTTFDVTGTGPGLPATGISYNPSAGGYISFNGWSVRITEAPVSGDSFTIGANPGAVSDGRNALALGLMQTRNMMVGGTTTFQGAYSQLVSQIGNKTSETQVTGKAQDALLAKNKDVQQSLSGVNLDEEAANLMRYQQAYQAAGKMLQIANTIFDTLLNIR